MDYDPADAMRQLASHAKKVRGKSITPPPDKDESVPEYMALGLYVLSTMRQALGEQASQDILRALGALIIDNRVPSFQAQICMIQSRKVKLMVLMASEQGVEMTPALVAEIIQEAKDEQAKDEAAKAQS